MPDSLFHYQPFNEAHVISLLSERTIKLSRPDKFNDPWDCRMRYRVPETVDERNRALAWFEQMHRKQYPCMNEAERAVIMYRHKSTPGALETSISKLGKEMYPAVCQQYRVYCLTEKPDSALMWGHYARSHTGICLEFDAMKVPFTAATKVSYQTTHPIYDVVTGGSELFFNKSNDWSYEAEWRLVAEERAFARSRETIKTDDDFLVLPPGVLKSVIIGSLADARSRHQIERLIKQHAKGILVRQTTIAPDRYGLIINPSF